MVNLHTAVLAVGVSVAMASTSARNVPGLSLWEANNATANASASKKIGLLANGEVIYSFCGIDVVGGDIDNKAGANPDSCIGHCRPEAGCDAATWTNYNGGWCWLKQLRSSWASAVPSVGAVSFIRTPTNTPGYMGPAGLPRTDFDMPGNDLTNFQGTETQCYRPCITNAFCFAYSWTNFNGGTCWLKSKASPFVYSPGAKSDFSGRVTNPDTCLTQF